MLEAQAHLQLKALLRQEGVERWPHHLTLCRLVGRSLRRGDRSMIRLAAGTDPSWMIGLMVPLSLVGRSTVLVVSEELRQRILQVEWPRLRAVGVELACWEGLCSPPGDQVWLLNPHDLVAVWRNGDLGDRQLVIPEAERLEDHLRQALALRLEPRDWDSLRRARPAAEPSLLTLHERLSRRILGQPRHPDHLVRLAPEDEAPLRQLLNLLTPLPAPWSDWLESGDGGWTSWAEVDPGLLQWRLHRQPLEPMRQLAALLTGRGAVLIGELAGSIEPEQGRLSPLSGPVVRGLNPELVVDLSDPPLSDPLPLFCPLRQPLPNSPHYAEHLLEQGRRLVLGQSGLTVVLVDDAVLRHGLASGLAAEFGSRVGHECTAPDSNGVICASWRWWLEQQQRLPLPEQIVVALLPIASLEDPLTAARVASIRQRGGDWFRSLLLPDAINRLQRGVACLRRSGGRLAILDGRVRARGWGQMVLRGLEPWLVLSRLLPD